jgi:hypothetical protein
MPLTLTRALTPQNTLRLGTGPARHGGVAWDIPGGQYPGYLNARFRNWMGQGGGQGWADYFVYTTVILNLGPGTSGQANFKIQADSSFECVGFAINAVINGAPASGIGIPFNTTVQIADGGSSRNLFSQPVQVALLGTSNFPFQGSATHILPVSRRFVSNSQVNVFMQNLDTVNFYQTVQFSFIGRKIFHSRRADAMGRRPQFKSWRGSDGRLYAEDYYGYVVNVPTLPVPASGTAFTPVDTVIESDSDFELILMGATGLRNVTTGAPTLPPTIKMQLIDGGEGRSLFSDFTFVPSIAGAAGMPFILPITRIFLAKTPLTTQLINWDNVPWNNVQLLFEGRKIFAMHEGG